MFVCAFRDLYVLMFVTWHIFQKADVRPIDVNISGGYIFHLSLYMCVFSKMSWFQLGFFPNLVGQSVIHRKQDTWG